MSEPLSYARVQIVYGDVSLYLEAPAGRVTTLNLSALDRSPAEPGVPKRGRMRLVVAALAGCLVVVGLALAWVTLSVTVVAAWDRPGDLPATPPPRVISFLPSPPPSAAPAMPDAPAGNAVRTGLGEVGKAQP